MVSCSCQKKLGTAKIAFSLGVLSLDSSLSVKYLCSSDCGLSSFLPRSSALWAKRNALYAAKSLRGLMNQLATCASAIRTYATSGFRTRGRIHSAVPGARVDDDRLIARVAHSFRASRALS